MQEQWVDPQTQQHLLLYSSLCLRLLIRFYNVICDSQASRYRHFVCTPDEVPHRIWAVDTAE